MLTRPALRATRAAAVAAISLAALPALSQAADAPLRTIGIDVAGARTGDLYPRGVSADGREVILQGGEQAFVRDVAAGTTKALFPAGDSVRQTSNDTKQVLVETERKLVAADTDTTSDLYLFDRNTGAAQLVTQDKLGLIAESTSTDYAYSDEAVLAGGGKVALVSITRFHTDVQDTPGDQSDELWRFDGATGALTKLSSQRRVLTNRLDDAGRVAVTREGIRIDNRTLPLPYDPEATYASATVAPDASAIAFQIGYDKSKITVVNTTTGVKRVVTVPAWLAAQDYGVYAPYNAGGNALLLGTKVSRPGGLRYVFGKLEVSNGALAQVGGDIAITEQTTVAAISSSLLFAVTPNHLAQLGTTPLPGVEPTAPNSVNALDYLTFNDASCINNFWYQTWYKPNLRLKAAAQGNDLRLATKAEVKVTMKNGTIVNQFSLAPNQLRELSTGRTGNFTYSARVTFNDGSVGEGSQFVGPHTASPSVICPFPL